MGETPVGTGYQRWRPHRTAACTKKLRPRRSSRLNMAIVWQLTRAEEEEATGTTESWKDECSASSAPSGGAPELFE